MKHRLIMALAVTVLLAAGGVVTASAQGTQQERMKLCNTQANAHHLIGSDRMQFMSTCLSKRGREHMQMNTQQQKMKSCNADANVKGLKGAARKRYMSACLRGK